jgi:putative transposase
MIDRDHQLSVTKQAGAAGIARSTVYDLPRPVSADDLALMSKIDRLHADYPCAGSRMLRGLLALDGLDASAASRDGHGSKAGRRHVKTLMVTLADLRANLP